MSTQFSASLRPARVEKETSGASFSPTDGLSLLPFPAPVEELSENSSGEVNQRKDEARDTASCLFSLSAVFLAFAYWFSLYSLETLISTQTELGMTTAFLGACQAIAWFAHRKRRSAGSELFLFGSCLAFTAGLVAIAAGQNVSQSAESFVQVDRLALVGLLPLVLVADSLLVHLVFSLAVWFVGYSELATPLDDYWLIHLIGLALIPGFVWGYRRNSSLLIGINASLLAMWLLVEPTQWMIEEFAAFAAPCLGTAYLFVAERHSPGNPLRESWRVPGLLLIGTTMYYLGQSEVWRSLESTSPESGFSRMTSEAFAAGSLLVAFVVTFHLYVARRHAEQPARDAGIAIARQFWFPASVISLVMLQTAWYCSPHSSLGWKPLPVIAANLTSLLLAVHLIDEGFRRKNGYSTAGGVLCAVKVLWLSCLIVDPDDHRVTIMCILVAFGLALLGLALASIHLKPAQEDAFCPQPGKWHFPRRVSTARAFIDAHANRLLIVAFAVQHAMLVLLYLTLN